MMNFQHVYCVALAGILVGYSVAPSAAEQPKHCCFSFQWEGFVIQRMGQFVDAGRTASLSDIESTTHCDYNINKIATSSKVFNGSTTVYVDTLQDYNAGVIYSVVGDKCYKTKTQGPLPRPCVPEGAPYLGTHKYLSSIIADSWLLPMEAGYTARMTLARDTCWPIYASMFRPGNQTSMLTQDFLNVTKGIRDPKVFDVPAICQNHTRSDLDADVYLRHAMKLAREHLSILNRLG